MTMLRREREDLERLSRDRERLAKSGIDARVAELKADFEQQLSARYNYDQNEIWKEAFERAKEVASEAQAAVTHECKKLGIPSEFAPRMELYWGSRGENAVKERRTELRRTAHAQIDALAKQAKVNIALKASEVRVRLVEGSLESDDAKKFLMSMSTAADLMPKLSLPKVEQAIKHQGMLQ